MNGEELGVEQYSIPKMQIGQREARATVRVSLWPISVEVKFSRKAEP